MKRLPTTARACKSRLFGWSRRVDPDGCVHWHLFRRCSNGKVYGQSFAAAPIDQRSKAARGIRAARAQLRWSVDQVEFARLGLHDDTPPPIASTTDLPGLLLYQGSDAQTLDILTSMGNADVCPPGALRGEE